MLVTALCPNCLAKHELTSKLVGDAINCQKCHQPFVVKEYKGGGIEDAEVLEVEHGFSTNNSSSTSTRRAPKTEKHSLTLPPPPLERWLPVEKKNEKFDSFEEFDHDAEDLHEFLEREEGVDDYSWLLVMGLIMTILAFLAILVWIVYLLVR